jgi:hypothetical protein
MSASDRRIAAIREQAQADSQEKLEKLEAKRQADEPKRAAKTPPEDKAAGVSATKS